LLTGGIAETSIFWSHKGQQLRCRPDYMKGDMVIDLKSAQDASPTGFAKAVSNFGYDMQQAIYEDGSQCNEFYFVVTENKPPYLTAVYSLKGEDIAKARTRYYELLAGWKACNEFDTFPGYSETITELSLPVWHKP